MNHDLAHTEKKLRFDGTVTAGNLLTVLGFTAAIFVAWASIDTRVTILERTDAEMRSAFDRETTHTRSVELEIKQALRDVVSKLDRLIERAPAPTPR